MPNLIRSLDEATWDAFLTQAEHAREIRAASVGAIYQDIGTKRVRPCGSCVFVQHKGFDFVVTAEHVLHEARSGPLILVGFGGAAPLRLSFATMFDRGIDPQHDIVDIAVAFLEPDTKERIGAIAAVSSDDLANTGDSWNRGFLAVGFPASKNKQAVTTRKATPEPHAFMMRAKEVQFSKQLRGFHPQSHLLLNWNPRDAIKPDRSRNTAPSLAGTSGGPVFDIGDFTSMEILAGIAKPKSKLVGIITRWLESESALIVSRLPMVFDEMIEVRLQRMSSRNGSTTAFGSI